MRWIKIHEGLLDWGWHDMPEMVSLWVHLLLKANYEDREWRSATIARGSLITTMSDLSEMTGLSPRQLRTCLARLEQTGEIERKTTNKFSHITICKYDSYQVGDFASDNQATNKRQTSDNQTTNERQTTIESKNLRTKETVSKDTSKKVGELQEEARKVTCQKIEFAQRVHLTQKEFDNLVAAYGEEDTRWMIDKLSAYKVSKNKSYSSDAAAIRSWVVDRLNEEKQRTKQQPTTNNYTNDKYW